MPKSATINTVQGIGDIFWCYQKLAPYFDVINMNIFCVDLGPIQLRAKAFCAMLPKAGAVSYVRVLPGVYNKLASSRHHLADVLKANGSAVDYAVNAPLEVGVNLRDIDPGSMLEEFVDMGLPAEVAREDYLCVFVAGSKNSKVWRADQWVVAIRKLAERMGTARVALIGAAWDRQVQGEVDAALRTELQVENHVGTAALAETVDIIRRSRFFFGYQSGLNVIAENYDVPQLMVYFKYLEPMAYTWCKPDSIGTRFHAATFADDADKMVEGVSLPALVPA